MRLLKTSLYSAPLRSNSAALTGGELVSDMRMPVDVVLIPRKFGGTYNNITNSATADHVAGASNTKSMSVSIHHHRHRHRRHAFRRENSRSLMLPTISATSERSSGSRGSMSCLWSGRTTVSVVVGSTRWCWRGCGNGFITTVASPPSVERRYMGKCTWHDEGYFAV